MYFGFYYFGVSLVFVVCVCGLRVFFWVGCVLRVCLLVLVFWVLCICWLCIVVIVW